MVNLYKPIFYGITLKNLMNAIGAIILIIFLLNLLKLMEIKLDTGVWLVLALLVLILLEILDIPIKLSRKKLF